MSGRRGHDGECSRRELLRAGVRGVAIAAVASVAAVLAARGLRRGGIDRSEQTCDNRNLCRSCGRLSDCGLPAAVSLRQRAEGI